MILGHFRCLFALSCCIRTHGLRDLMLLQRLPSHPQGSVLFGLSCPAPVGTRLVDGSPKRAFRPDPVLHMDRTLPMMEFLFFCITCLVRLVPGVVLYKVIYRLGLEEPWIFQVRFS
jgi:hypothetical protein